MTPQVLMKIISKNPIFILIFVVFLIIGLGGGNWFCQEMHKGKIQQLENQIDELNQKLQEFKTQRDSCIIRERELESNLSSCYRELTNCDQIADQLQNCIEEKNRLQNKFDNCTKEKENLENEVNKLRGELNYKITLSSLFRNYTYYSLPFWLFFLIIQIPISLSIGLVKVSGGIYYGLFWVIFVIFALITNNDLISYFISGIIVAIVAYYKEQK